MKLWSKILRGLAGRHESAAPDIKQTPNGFSVAGHDFSVGDITKVVGYKRDLITVDEVRLDLTFRSGAQISVSEDQPGFAALVGSLCSAFPSISGWEQKIVGPAFAANCTVLYVDT